MLIPIGHENMEARRWPVITIGLIVLNLLIFALTIGTLSSESPELAETRLHIRLLAAAHPELALTPAAQKLVEDGRRSNPQGWAAARSPFRQLQDDWDARMRKVDDPAELQAEMDRLSARYEVLSRESALEHYAFVPAHPTWYSYITANFLHGGLLHVIGNMWFLWLAGIVLEDAWGRGLYLLVYLAAGAFALQVDGWFHPASYTPTLGASGAVAALMGAFLVRFPTVRIRMVWLWGFFFPARFSAAAYWLLPVWFLMEIFQGALFGQNSGVAHWAHAGGFAFGMAAALLIRHSGLEHRINRAIEDQLDPFHHSELDTVQQLIGESRFGDALVNLHQYNDGHPECERALLLEQELYWRMNNIPDYARVTLKLCAFHLAQQATEQAVKDYETLVQSSGILLPAELWMKLCQGLEDRQEYERAVGEYQELAQTYPNERQSLMALLAGGRVAMHRLKRPQQALLFYQAAADSAIPHLDLDSSIQSGIKGAKSMLAAGPAYN